MIGGALGTTRARLEARTRLIAVAESGTLDRVEAEATRISWITARYDEVARCSFTGRADAARADLSETRTDHFLMDTLPGGWIAGVNRAVVAVVATDRRADTVSSTVALILRCTGVAVIARFAGGSVGRLAVAGVRVTDVDDTGICRETRGKDAGDANSIRVAGVAGCAEIAILAGRSRVRDDRALAGDAGALEARVID